MFGAWGRRLLAAGLGVTCWPDPHFGGSRGSSTQLVIWPGIAMSVAVTSYSHSWI